MAILSPYKRRISAVRWTISFIILVPLVTIWILFLNGRLQSYQVISGSMEPTLLVGDYVLMKKEHHFGDLTGMIIVFLDPTNGRDALTKRVLAGSFSRVKLRNGQLYLGNSEAPVPGEAIRDVPNQTWDLGEDELFVVGDNRNHSFDSVEFGPIKRSSVQGVLTYRYWPWARRGNVQVEAPGA